MGWLQKGTGGGKPEGTGRRLSGAGQGAPSGNGHRPVSPQTKKRALLLLVNTVAILFLYYGCYSLGFRQIFFVYLGLLAVLAVVYVVYNRGFVYKNATPELLPDTMTPEEKQATLEEARRRLRASDWMLMLIIPLVVTFLADAIYLFFLADFLESMGWQLT